MDLGAEAPWTVQARGRSAHPAHRSRLSARLQGRGAHV
jgi:hypothetical protein